jgi:hypothetical protein
LPVRPRYSRRNLPPLEERFSFEGDAITPGDRKALRSALFDVEDRQTGYERCLKLWRKTGTPVDDDLRQLWLHEMRQVQRIMAYAGARDVIVDILEIVEDAESFGVLLERAGQPLSVKLIRVSRQHWLKNLSAPDLVLCFGGTCPAWSLRSASFTPKVSCMANSAPTR